MSALRFWLLILMILIVARPVAADGPNYTVPGRLALPWACGEGHQVTWGPGEHWANQKATGVAYDFSMVTGTPVFSPANGMAYFLYDERPLETNFGNYVEIVTEDGDWLVRLAHLRDFQSGERPVKAGELVGYSGASGVPIEHLHLELLVREGGHWGCPDLARIQRFFGLPMAAFTEGAIITNGGCAGRLAVSGEVTSLPGSLPLGETADLFVPLCNMGFDPLVLDTVQVSLSASGKRSLVADVEGEWLVDGQGECVVRIPIRPTSAGEWDVGRVTYRADGKSVGLLAKGRLTVLPPPLRCVSVSMDSIILQVGERISLQVWLENAGHSDLYLDDLQIEGVRPDGAPWTASLGRACVVPAGEVGAFTLESAIVPQNVGLWKALRIGYRRGGQLFSFDQVNYAFGVFGAEIRASRMDVYASRSALHVFIALSNVGTQVVSPDRVEIWGWKSNGEDAAVAREMVSLAPGESTLVQFDLPLQADEWPWRLAEVGYWMGGAYYRILLPRQPGVLTEEAAMLMEQAAMLMEQAGVPVEGGR